MKAIKLITYLSLSLLVFTSLSTFAQGDDEYALLKQANQEYTAGEYQKAVDDYQKLVNSGHTSGELYYNLGNAYYRVGNYKSAILYYERAKLLLPNNENINYNLKESRKYVKDKLDEIPEFFLTTWLNSFENMFSERSWSIISILTFILFLSSILIFLYSKNLTFRKLSFYIGVISFFVSIASFYGASQQYDRITNRDYAIIFSPSVTVKSAPNENGTELFIIHEGLKVKIEGSSNGWKEIKLSDGRVGWLPDDTVELI